MRDNLSRAMRLNPYDDLPRLVYADWLEEEGLIDEAIFLRDYPDIVWYGDDGGDGGDGYGGYGYGNGYGDGDGGGYCYGGDAGGGDSGGGGGNFGHATGSSQLL